MLALAGDDGYPYAVSLLIAPDGSAVLAEGEDWTRIWDKIQADTPFALSSSMWFPVAGEE